MTVNGDTKLYIKCMEETRDRLVFVKTFPASGGIGSQFIDKEIVFLQLRKILELIAFASLTANREKYAAAHANLGRIWRAKQMLDDLEKINPQFYPRPVQRPQLQNGIKHMAAVVDGFLTKDDFVSLYDLSSKFLHVGNPFGTQDSIIRMRYNVRQWLERIQALIALHLMHLVGGNVWIVEVPEQGPVHVFPAEPQITVATST